LARCSNSTVNFHGFDVLRIATITRHAINRRREFGRQLNSHFLLKFVHEEYF